MTTKVKKLVLCLGLLVASLLWSYQSAYAEPITQDVSYIRSSVNPTIQAGGNCSADGTNAIKGTANGCVASGLIVTLPYSEYLKGDIIEIDLNIVHYENDNALNAWLFKMQADSTNLANTPVALMSVDYQSITQNTGVAKFYIMVGAYTNNMPTVGLSGNIFLYNHDFLSVSSTTCWRPSVDSSSAIISAINNSATDLSTTNNKIDSVVSAIEDLQDTTEEYISVQEQANQDANDRYQDEKDTIYNEAGNGQDSMDDLSSDMSASFSLPNPFTAFFGLFVNGCSVNIPTLSSWLGSVDTVYPSWWCTTSKLQNIRNALTAVFSFLSVCLTFSFVFKWLRTNSGEL